MNMNPSTKGNDLRFAGQLAALCFLLAFCLHRLVLAISIHPFAQPLRAPHLAKTLLQRPDWSQTQQIIIDHHPVVAVGAGVGAGAAAGADFVYLTIERFDNNPQKGAAWCV